MLCAISYSPTAYHVARAVVDASWLLWWSEAMAQRIEFAMELIELGPSAGEWKRRQKGEKMSVAVAAAVLTTHNFNPIRQSHSNCTQFINTARGSGHAPTTKPYYAFDVLYFLVVAFFSYLLINAQLLIAFHSISFQSSFQADFIVFTIHTTI